MQAEFSKECTALITNANAPDLITKVLDQREIILQMQNIEGEIDSARSSTQACPAYAAFAP